MGKPVSSRVASPDADRVLRNHDERMRDLELRATGSGRGWRSVSAWALLPTTQAVAYTKSASQFIAGANLSALWAFELAVGQRIVAIHTLVISTGPGSMSLRFFNNSLAGIAQVGPRVTNGLTGKEILSIEGLQAVIQQGAFDAWAAIVGMSTGDAAITLALETETV